MNVFQKESTSLNLKFNNTKLKIKQIIKEDEDSLRGTIANGHLKTRKTKQVEFIRNISSDTEEFITIFAIYEKQNERSPSKEIDIDQITINKKNYSIEILVDEKLVHPQEKQ